MPQTYQRAQNLLTAPPPTSNAEAGDKAPTFCAGDSLVSCTHSYTVLCRAGVLSPPLLQVGVEDTAVLLSAHLRKMRSREEGPGQYSPSTARLLSLPWLQSPAMQPEAMCRMPSGLLSDFRVMQSPQAGSQAVNKAGHLITLL